MSRVKRRGFNWSPHPVLESGVTEAYVSMGTTAENVARMYGISREEQEAFALASHTKAAEREVLNPNIIGGRQRGWENREPGRLHSSNDHS